MDKQYNVNHRRYVELQEGEQFCPKCNGKGRVKKNNLPLSITLECDKCLGSGKLDWIEKATGKKVKQIYGYEA